MKIHDNPCDEIDMGIFFHFQSLRKYCLFVTHPSRPPYFVPVLVNFQDITVAQRNAMRDGFLSEVGFVRSVVIVVLAPLLLVVGGCHPIPMVVWCCLVLFQTILSQDRVIFLKSIQLLPFGKQLWINAKATILWRFAYQRIIVFNINVCLPDFFPWFLKTNRTVHPLVNVSNWLPYRWGSHFGHHTAQFRDLCMCGDRWNRGEVVHVWPSFVVEIIYSLAIYVDSSSKISNLLINVCCCWW